MRGDQETIEGNRLPGGAPSICSPAEGRVEVVTPLSTICCEEWEKVIAEGTRPAYGSAYRNRSWLLDMPSAALGWML